MWEWLGKWSSTSSSNDTKRLIIKIENTTPVPSTFLPNIQIIILAKIQTSSTESIINRIIKQKINPNKYKHKTDIRATKDNAKDVTRYSKT